MDAKGKSKRGVLLASVFFAFTFMLASCAPPKVRHVEELCQGKANINQAVAAIAARRESMAPFRASGRCKLTWYDDKGKKHTESPDVRLYFYPPYRLFFDGKILSQEIFRLGSNADQFWFRMKPESVFYFGKRKNAGKCQRKLLIDPADLIEALGVITVDDTWKLSHSLGQDILTKVADGKVQKRIYINACDYGVSRIEYFDEYGDMTLTAELSGRGNAAPNLSYPTKINITSGGGNGLALNIRLKNLKPLTDAQIKPKLFKIAPTRGFDNIFELDGNCDFIRNTPGE
jgi:hypothetical protein